MDLLLGIAVHLAILAGAWKLWRWSRQQYKAARTVWRRRVGLTFLLAPFLLTLLSALGAPEALLAPLVVIGWLRLGIDHALAALTGAAKDALPGPIAIAVKPLLYAVVYGGLGVLIGWPLDRRAQKKAEAAAQAAGSGGGGGPPSSGSTPA